MSLQAQAHAQAQQAAEEACHYDATAQTLQAQANLMASKHMAASSQRRRAELDGGHGMPQPIYLPDRFQTPGSPVQHAAAGGGEGLPRMPGVTFGSRQAGHDSGSPSAALLERALLGIPDADPVTELDDGQLILAAAEVHFEDYAALRSHSVPCNASLPSAIKRSQSQQTTAVEQQEVHPSIHRSASQHDGLMIEDSALQLKME